MHYSWLEGSLRKRQRLNEADFEPAVLAAAAAASSKPAQASPHPKAAGEAGTSAPGAAASPSPSPAAVAKASAAAASAAAAAALPPLRSLAFRCSKLTAGDVQQLLLHLLAGRPRPHWLSIHVSFVGERAVARHDEHAAVRPLCGLCPLLPALLHASLLLVASRAPLLCCPPTRRAAPPQWCWLLCQAWTSTSCAGSSRPLCRSCWLPAGSAWSCRLCRRPRSPAKPARRCCRYRSLVARARSASIRSHPNLQRQRQRPQGQAQAPARLLIQSHRLPRSWRFRPSFTAAHPTRCDSSTTRLAVPRQPRQPRPAMQRMAAAAAAAVMMHPCRS